MDMSEWFYNPQVEFEMFGPAHIVTIGTVVLLVIAFYLFRNKLFPYRKGIRITIGWAMIGARLALDIWYLATDQWHYEFALPLELCSISLIMGGIMLLTKSRVLFEIIYFIAIGGAVQAIMTPFLNYGFPQFRYMQFFFAHLLVLIAPLIMTWLYQYKITWQSLLKSFIAVNGIALVNFVLDSWLNVNYMYLAGKPDSASMLDILGPYPYYILSLEAVALLIFSLLYLPFGLVSIWQKNQRSSAGNR